MGRPKLTLGLPSLILTAMFFVPSISHAAGIAPTSDSVVIELACKE